MSYPLLTIAKGKEHSIQRKHPWVFSGALASDTSELQDGDLVCLTPEPGTTGADSLTGAGLAAVLAVAAARAALDHRVEIRVHAHVIAIRAHDLGERARHDQPVEGKVSALVGIDPEQGRIVGALGHGEHADGISAQQYLRRDSELWLASGHEGRVVRPHGPVKGEDFLP